MAKRALRVRWNTTMSVLLPRLVDEPSCAIAARPGVARAPSKRARIYMSPNGPARSVFDLGAPTSQSIQALCTAESVLKRRVLDAASTIHIEAQTSLCDLRNRASSDELGESIASPKARVLRMPVG